MEEEPDGEPSLGWCQMTKQESSGWSSGLSADDREDEHDGREPDVDAEPDTDAEPCDYEGGTPLFDGSGNAIAEELLDTLEAPRRSVLRLDGRSGRYIDGSPIVGEVVGDGEVKYYPR